MKYFHLHGELNNESLASFYNFLNQYETEDCTISIRSGGGMTCVAKSIINAINSRKETVTLICHEAYSGAFEIFYSSNCKKILAETCKGMYHLSAAKMWMIANKQPFEDEDKVIVKNWEESSCQSEFVKKFMTKKELSEFKKGNDVYFTFKRMKEIFPDAEII